MTNWFQFDQRLAAGTTSCDLSRRMNVSPGSDDQTHTISRSTRNGKEFLGSGMTLKTYSGRSRAPRFLLRQTIMVVQHDAKGPTLAVPSEGDPIPASAPAVGRERNRREKLPDLSPGAVIKPYELIRQIGSGGMGLVFLARDVRLGRLVAIKFLVVETRSAVERFVVEARTTAACRHENIVVIYDVGEIAGFPYLVLEYIQGRTLRERMLEAIPDRPKLAVELLLPVARALACAHGMGVIHRDLKPENILISETGQVKVVDFGIAKQIAAMDPRGGGKSVARGSRRPLTEDGALVGSTEYMSPEQWLGEPVDARADIWAIGLILFEIATGFHPMELLIAEDLADVTMLDVPMPSAQDQIPGHSDLARIIDKCLMKQAHDRFSSAAELVEALERLQQQQMPVRAIAEHECPFAGLSAFQETDAGYFFGRDDEVAAILARLRQEPLVAIAGPSGAGKSSFVRAGVIPAFKRVHRDVETCVVRPGRQPLAALTDMLVSLEDPEADRDCVAAMMRSEPGYLGARLRARCKKRGDGQRLVLFIDQFEELYTQEIQAAERAAFCACLEGVADDASSPLRVIVTIRSDFLDRVAEERRHLAEMTRGLVFLPAPTVDGLQQALEKPLESAGYRFEDEKLVFDILDGLAGMKTPLPLLQFMAAKLWDARDCERRLLTRDAYVSLGGVAGALSTHADAVLAAMTPQEWRLARSIFSRLVTSEKTRAVLSWDQLVTLTPNAVMVEQVLQHLANARLLHIEAGHKNSGRTVELTHESLIDGWSTLRQWLQENEADAKFLAEVRLAAMQWEDNGRTDDFLWRGQAAVRAKEWLTHYREHADENRTLEIGTLKLNYLDAVVRLADRTTRKRKQWLGGVMTFLCGVIFVVSFFWLQAQNEARRADVKAIEAAKNADEAKRSALEARNATKMAVASALRSDATLALALVREVDPTLALPYKWDELAQWVLQHEIARVVLTHPEPAQWAAQSPDGKHIVTASWDGITRVWNADGSGEPILLEGHSDQVQSAEFSPDGQRIVTASSDKTARIWNANGLGKPIVLEGHQEAVMSAAFSRDGLRVATGSADKTVRFWNADGSGTSIVHKGHEGTVNSVAFSPDGKRFVSASDDGTARVWNADRQGREIVLRGHRDRVHSAAFSPDGQRIVTASFDNTARVWAADGKGPPVVLTGHVNAVRSAAFSPDGKTIVTASWDRTARVWNSDARGNPLLILEGHQDKLCSASFSPDGKRIVTAALDKSVRVWDADRRDKPRRLEGHDGTILSAAFSPDGRHIVTAAIDSTARVWDLADTKAPLVLRGHVGKVASASFRPDGRQIVTASQDKTVRVWDAQSGETLHVLRGHDDAVWSAAYRPDGKRIVSASWDKTVRVWNVDGHDEPLVLRGHEDTVNSAAFSPDGKSIISASEDKTARIWNADGSGEARVLRGHSAGVYSAAFSPDGRHIITASWDKTVRIHDSEGNDPPRVFKHGAAVGTGAIGGAGAFSPDGDRFVTIADDKTLHIWRTNGVGEPIVVHFPELYPTIAAFSPDGSRIVTASHEQKDSMTGMSRFWGTVWPTLNSLTGPDDARLWRATTYCPPVALRRELLGVSEKLAEEHLAKCRQRVARAFDPALR